MIELISKLTLRIQEHDITTAEKKHFFWDIHILIEMHGSGKTQNFVMSIVYENKSSFH